MSIALRLSRRAACLLIALLAARVASAAPGDIETIAGSLGEGPALTIGQYAQGVAFRAGKIYVADSSNHAVRAVDLNSGYETVVAGSGQSGYTGDGGPALGAKMNGPAYVAVDGAGNVFIDDQNNRRIRRVDAITGVITTIVGDGEYGYAGDGGPGTSARFTAAYGMATDSVGNLFFCDTNNGRVRRWDAVTEIVDTVALSGCWGLAIDAADNLYLGDEHTVHRADAGTYALTAIGTTDGPPGSTIAGVAVDASGNVYASEPNAGRVWRIDAGTLATSRYAGGGTPTPNLGDGGPASDALLINPWGLAVDDAGSLYVASFKVRKVDAGTSIISTVAGNGFGRFGGDGGPATNAQIDGTIAVTVDALGRLYLSGGDRPGIRRIDLDGSISTIAGGGDNDADGIPATEAYLDAAGLAIDTDGSIFVAEPGPDRVRKIDATTGLISTVAGGNDCGPEGDGGPATAAQLCGPFGLALDAAGNLYIAEEGNAAIRRVDRPTGIISTVAGTIGTSIGPVGDGGPATSATLQSPRSVAVDDLGRIYIAELGGHRVRRVSTAGIITTIAGTGVHGYNGDGIPATDAQLASPYSVAFDLAGNVIITDADNERVRRIDSAGIIHTVAGTGTSGYTGDGGPASAARLFVPIGTAAHPSGSLYILDQNYRRVRTTGASDGSAARRAATEC